MYLDTANTDEIKEALKTGIIKGVTTNPTILKNEMEKRSVQIEKIVKTGVKKIFVQVIGMSADEMFRDYLEIRKISKKTGFRLSVKVPVTMDGLEAISMIRKADRDTEILGTAIYSAGQGILGAIAGCDSLAPYVNRMQNNSINPYEEISKIRKFIDSRGLGTKILAASFKNTGQITDAISNGAHTCTVPFSLLKQMCENDTVLSAVRVFNEDGRITG